VVATLLVADAWFDITTSATAKAATGALILALAVELPAAAFSLYVAHRVGRRVRELAHLEHLAGPVPTCQSLTGRRRTLRSHRSPPPRYSSRRKSEPEGKSPLPHAAGAPGLHTPNRCGTSRYRLAQALALLPRSA